MYRLPRKSLCEIRVSQKHDELPITCPGVAGEVKPLRYYLLLFKACERQLGRLSSVPVDKKLFKRVGDSTASYAQAALALRLELALGAVCDLE